ncbi:MAG: isomerase [Bacteroidetes bacterium]|nr:MAG: isomerase [Bacteroidota bacterium]
MHIKLFQVDAFADRLFKGNPAAVCPLDHWIEEEQMQAIAMENNLAETAFFVPGESPLQIRWFTPVTEVELCGHATLASAHVLYKHLGYHQDLIQFDSQSGPLSVIVEGEDRYTLDFPADALRDVVPDLRWKQYFNLPIIEAYRGATDYIFRVESEGAVRDMQVKFHPLKEADGRGFIVTAEGSDCDYVARCFYPQAGIDEDAATGSSHTTLAPFWADKLGKKKFTARQLSTRGAYFETEVRADRVLITGQAISFMQGTIDL